MPGLTPSPTGTTPAERELGISLYRLRLENGLSLRALAQRLGYNAHSVVSDIEKGRKIPSESLIRGYEQCFGLPPGTLLALRRRAMADRAERLAARFASDAAPPQPLPTPTPAPTPHSHSHPQAERAVPEREFTVPQPPAAGEESVADVFGRLVVAVLHETRRLVGRWQR